MDSIAAQNEIISISSDSPDQSIADVGTERTNVNPIRDTPGIDVLPSIETPDSNNINNQVMEYVLQKRPDLTRGEVLFFSLPLPVRYRIYEYHEILYRSTSEAPVDQSSLSVRTPLSQTCRTFRREIKGLALSQMALFNTEEEMQKFTKMCRSQCFGPFLCVLAFNLALPKSQLGSLDNIRRVLERASQEFQYVTVLVFYIQSARDSTFGILRQLMQDGTIARFTRLEIVCARDKPVKERYNTSYNQQARALINRKLAEWTQAGKIQEDINTEILSVARCMMRLRILNTEFVAAIRGWRRDSAVDVGSEQVEKPQSPREDTAISEDATSAASEMNVDAEFDTEVE